MTYDYLAEQLSKDALVYSGSDDISDMVGRVSKAAQAIRDLQAQNAKLRAALHAVETEISSEETWNPNISQITKSALEDTP